MAKISIFFSFLVHAAPFNKLHLIIFGGSLASGLVSGHQVVTWAGFDHLANGWLNIIVRVWRQTWLEPAPHTDYASSTAMFSLCVFPPLFAKCSVKYFYHQFVLISWQLRTMLWNVLFFSSMNSHWETRWSVFLSFCYLFLFIWLTVAKKSSEVYLSSLISLSDWQL